MRKVEMDEAAKNLSILLIDDEQDFASTLAMRLNLRGFHACAVFDGEAGLAKLEEEPFGVVVLDVRLPGLSGLDVLRRIHAERPGLPVILLTGHSCGEEGIDEAGAVTCLTKPLELGELLHVLNRLGGENA